MGRISNRDKRARSHAGASIEALEGRRLLSASVVKDIHTGGSDSTSDPSPVVHVGSLNLFSAFDPEHGYEMWRTDGTARGTQLIADLAPRFVDVRPESYAALGGRAYFVALNALWQTDGTARGTFRVQPDQRIQYFTKPRSLQTFNGALYFADTGAGGTVRLWRSDGTPNGYTLIHQLADPASAGATGAVNTPVVFGDALFYAGVDPKMGPSLWRTDGTKDGTRALGSLDVIGDFIPFRGALYFLAKSKGELGLWRADRTANGTVRVKSFPGATTKQGLDGAVTGNVLVFAATDVEHGTELWSTDGTEGGTKLIADLRPGQGSLWSVTQYTPEYDPPGGDPVCGCGTSELPPPFGSLGSFPSDFVITDNGLLFSAYTAEGQFVYQTDGTAEGTAKLTAFGTSGTRRVTGSATIGGIAYIAVQDSVHERGAIYASDGSQGGTRLIWNAPQRFGDISLEPQTARSLSNVEGSLFFAGFDPSVGLEMMRFDDTGGITGVAYDDANANGVRDRSELPLSGWRVFLDRNGDGVFNKGEKFVFADPDGGYGFPAYPEGDYTVRVVPATAGWTSTSVSAPVRRGVTTRRDVGASRLMPAYGSVSGNVFADADFDGQFDAGAGDKPFAGVRVYLDLNGNGFYTPGEPAARSDAAGRYRINGVLPGAYRIALVDLGAGYQYTAGIDQHRSVLANRTTLVGFAIAHGTHYGTIQGVLFDDRDGDGTKDANEPGFSSLTIYLTENSWWNAGINGITATTDSTGYYKFRGLLPGEYTLSISSPAPVGGWHTETPSMIGVILGPAEIATQSWSFHAQ